MACVRVIIPSAASGAIIILLVSLFGQVLCRTKRSRPVPGGGVPVRPARFVPPLPPGIPILPEQLKTARGAAAIERAL